MHTIHPYKLLLSLAMQIGATGQLCAQNVSSPYSILGIGDIETRDFSRYSGAGGTALARRNAFAYNYANPASLTALPYKTIHLDIVTRGRTSRFKELNVDTLSFPSNDLVIKRIAMAFKPTQKTAFAFGLRPYSSVNYLQLQDQAILDGNSSYTRIIDGSGGLNQVYFSVARQSGKRFSAGITAAWLFGSLAKETEYIGNTLDLFVTKSETVFYNGASLQGGLQYFSLPHKKWQHQWGLTASVNTRLKGTHQTEYTEGGSPTVIKKETEEDQSFKMPVTVGMGYTAVYKNKFSFSAEAHYYAWPYQKVNYANSYTDGALRLAAGIEYTKQVRQGNGLVEKFHWGMGYSMENSYVRIKGKQLMDGAFTLGGGINVSRHLSVYSNIEVGKRGQRSNGQIEENFTQFVVGLSLKDLWFGTKNLGRYN
jgi:hypothetical protein